MKSAYLVPADGAEGLNIFWAAGLSQQKMNCGLNNNTCFVTIVDDRTSLSGWTAFIFLYKIHGGFGLSTGMSRGVTRLDGAWGKKQVWRPPCSNLGSFGSKHAVLKKVLVTLLGNFRRLPQRFAPPPKWFGARGVVSPSLRPCTWGLQDDSSCSCQRRNMR